MTIASCLVSLALGSGMLADEPIRPIPAPSVRVTDDFWSPRLKTVREVTLPHVLAECERTGRLANFEVAAKKKPGGMTGLCFNDSDVYKTIEGAAVLLAQSPDPAIEARCDAIIELIAAAQEPDGYLYTPRTINDPKNPPPGGPARWSDMAMGHELYCAGHLYEAAAAYFEATGKRTLLDVAIKNATLVASVFGPGINPHPCGHPEIELGLARLHDATKDPKWLTLLEFFVQARGKAEGRGLYGEYAQDHAPVLEQTEAVGHAVRLGYLFAGATELSMKSGDARYSDAAAHVWDDIVRSKLYITGGIGSQGNNEGFGNAFDLPNSSAYNETCSSIAFVMWSERMFRATGEAKYYDVAERTLYNAMLAGWSLSGNAFFYPNPLESAHGRRRGAWFECACCPPNVIRFIASVPGSIYAARGRDVYVNLFIGSEAKFKVDGADVTITQRTEQPWGDSVSLSVSPMKPTRMAIRVRVPGWTGERPVPSDLYSFTDDAGSAADIRDPDGKPVTRREKGYAVIEREWRTGDTMSMRLPMQPRRIAADARVLSDSGRTAVQRGPLVYCLEGADQTDKDVLGFVADKAWKAERRTDLLGGVVTLAGTARQARRGVDGAVTLSEPMPVTAVPYFAWANRAPGSMCVWMASEAAAAKPKPAPTIANQTTPSSSFGGEVAALADQLEPKTSGDHDNPFLHWWPRKGTEEWVQYTFNAPTTVSGVDVYWFDDTGRGECRLPESWKLEARDGDRWAEVKAATGYGIEGDRYNTVRFEPVTTTALRIVVKSKVGWAGGIHEWRVSGAPQGAAQAASPEPRAVNLIPNPSFEEIDGDHPAAWTRSSWGGKGVHSTAATGHSGLRAAQIASTDGADISWSTTVPVEFNSRYRLSGWIKTQEVAVRSGGRGALLNVHNIQTARTTAITGTHDWTRVETEFDTGMNDAVTINCLFGGWGVATGTAWFDDVSMELLKKGEMPTPKISIDASATGEPISPYIYGQFIEHMGRCIYGGIWAEMLEDRKFFRPPGDKESPWETIGAARLIMQRDGAFVGEHTPTVVVSGSPAGISQTRLAVRAGKQYLGNVWLSGDATAAPITVTLSCGSGGAAQSFTIGEIGPEFAKHEFSFTASADCDDARLAITSEGTGTFRVGAASLMPSDNIRGFRADTLALLKDLDSPVYRWPGGNFVSGYDWRDGVGDRDRRPPRKNPAWTGIEHNDVGIHEFMDLCELLKTDAYIAVNTGLGSVDNAVAELQYVNGAADTPMGTLRESHGREKPWGVKFWGIGNEMYGSWQLGNVPLKEYTSRHNEFVDAMRKVDPSITMIAVGAAGEWSRTMLRDCADRMDHLSEHVYWQDRGSLLPHVRQAPDSLRTIADAHRAYRRELPNLAGRNIRICQDEWNYWYGEHVFGELGTRYFMKDALGCAAALNEFGRNSDLFFMANYAQTVNVIGAIKTSRTNAAMETTGLVLQLYRRHMGTIPCRTESSPTVDALAAWTPDRKALTIAVVNATTSPLKVPLALRGVNLTGTGVARVIASRDPMAYNDPDGARPIQIRESRVEGVRDMLDVEACSVTLYTLDVR